MEPIQNEKTEISTLSVLETTDGLIKQQEGSRGVDLCEKNGFCHGNMPLNALFVNKLCSAISKLNGGADYS